MSDDAQAGASAPRRRRVGPMGVLLPGDWWSIPLVDRKEREHAIDRLVDRQFGFTDGHPQLKREVRDELRGSAQQAAAAGGWLMAISLMQVQSVPLSATLVAYRVPGVSFEGDGARALHRTLEQSRGGDAELELAEGPTGVVLRKVSTGSGPERLGAAELAQILAEYWLDPQDGYGLVYLTFTTTVTALREVMVDLFDAIVANVFPEEDGEVGDERGASGTQNDVEFDMGTPETDSGEVSGE